MVGDRLGAVRLVRVYQGEKAPPKALSAGEFHYLIDRPVAQRSAANTDSRGGRGGRGGKGGKGGRGERDRGRSRHDRTARLEDNRASVAAGPAVTAPIDRRRERSRLLAPAGRCRGHREIPQMRSGAANAAVIEGIAKTSRGVRAGQQGTSGDARESNWCTCTARAQG